MDVNRDRGEVALRGAVADGVRKVFDPREVKVGRIEEGLVVGTLKDDRQRAVLKRDICVRRTTAKRNSPSFTKSANLNDLEVGRQTVGTAMRNVGIAIVIERQDLTVRRGESGYI